GENADLLARGRTRTCWRGGERGHGGAWRAHPRGVLRHVLALTRARTPCGAKAEPVRARTRALRNCAAPGVVAPGAGRRCVLASSFVSPPRSAGGAPLRRRAWPVASRGRRASRGPPPKRAAEARRALEARSTS